ncbi:hypothetical protein SAMN05518683_11675 [Salibacterium halotolerans]|uniref:Uncharacterized protein n=2 Tax=Salibacterium halotolerans TaxID=1884432 RepID=A0A1I5VKE6_9BACI|nr:hypothetical protein SAMN05518683_11675 [Salibacterium halotolerans]
MISNVPDFEKHRREKQKQADHDLTALLDAYSNWLKHNTNLREKVRAKHMFAEQAGCDTQELEEEPWRRYFEDWFAFDYVTVIGSRLFDMFIKENSAVLPPSQIQLSGLVLTAALEPYKVLSLHNGAATVSPLWEKEEKRLSSLTGDVPLSQKTSSILVRSVYCGFENRVFSPVVPLSIPENETRLKEWKQRYEKKEEEQRRLRFMKENGASWYVYTEPNP